MTPAPAPPRVPLDDPAGTDTVASRAEASWAEPGPGGEFHGVRLGGAAAQQTEDLTDVTFRDCVLQNLDLRRATVSDLLIEDGVIEDLDLSEARATRIALKDVRVGRLTLAGSVLRDVDLRGADLRSVGPVTGLRGAVVSSLQLDALAPAIAEELGLRVL